MKTLKNFLKEIKDNATKEKKEKLEKVIFEQCKSRWEDAASCEAPTLQF